MALLERGQRRYYERLHHQELAIASLQALYLNSKLSRDQSTAYTANDFYRFRELALGSSSRFSSLVCDAFYSLTDKLPAWVIATAAPIEELERGRKGQTVPHPRCWIGCGLILLLPKADGERVISPLALVDVEAAWGETLLMEDIDSHARYRVMLPPHPTEAVLEQVTLLYESDGPTQPPRDRIKVL